jgi:hypothetical protein
MSIMLDLPQELEDELAAEAARLNLPLAEYAARALAVGRTLSGMPKTGAELVAYWQNEGVIGSRQDITDSQEHARAVRHQAERRA